MLDIVRIKCLGSKSGVEAISTNESIVTIRLLPGLQFNRQKLVPFYRYGIKIGITQLIINIKRLGKDWHKILEDVIKSI